MDKLFTTGLTARGLGITEPRLNDLVRRGIINPPPRVVAGRRLWKPCQVRQAAEYLGVLTDELDQQLREGATYGI